MVQYIGVFFMLISLAKEFNYRHSKVRVVHGVLQVSDQFFADDIQISELL